MPSRNERAARALRAAICATLCASLASCGGNRAKAVDDGRIRAKTVVVEEKPYVDTLESFGCVEYATKNDVTALVAGRIDALEAREGSRVSAGQTLARLRNVQVEIELDRAESAVESAKAVLVGARAELADAELAVESRLLSLSKSELSISQKRVDLAEARRKLDMMGNLKKVGGVTDQAYRDAKTSVNGLETEIGIAERDRDILALGLRERDLDSAGIVPAAGNEERVAQFVRLNTRTVAARVETAEASLRSAESGKRSAERLAEELTIRSPVSGVLGAKYYEAGEYVKENEKLFTVMDTSRVYAVFPVQERDAIGLDRGSAVTLSVESLGTRISAEISEISPMADPSSGNFTVKSLVRNSFGMKPGMFVKCSIPRRAAEKRAAIPETALARKSGDGGSVFGVVNGMASIREVAILARKDGTLWLASGVKAGDVVIDAPSPFIKEGSGVAVE